MQKLSYIHAIRKRNKQFIAYFLLLCLATTLLPSSSFHSHEEESHFCEIQAEIEKNLCHVSIYHSDYQENLCEHNRHFSESDQDCDFCKYISSRRQLITFKDYLFDLKTAYLELPESQGLSFTTTSANGHILGRAPPIV